MRTSVKIPFVGGPLDGCVETYKSILFVPELKVFPDIVPGSKAAIVYRLDQALLVYKFSKEMPSVTE